MAPAAVLLLFAALGRHARAADPPVAPCAVIMHHRVGLLTDLVPAEPPIPADSDDCRIMQETRKDFLVLRDAAGLTPAEVSDVSFRDMKDESFSSFEDSVVVFGNNALVLLRRGDDFRRTVLAHELGHGLQKYRKLATSKAIPTDEESRAYEAQADALGREILIKAGFSTNSMKSGFESFADCGQYYDNRRSDHPSPEARVLNQDLLAQHDRNVQSVLSRVPGASSDLDQAFDGGAGRTDPQAGVSAGFPGPAIKTDDFNSRGILKADRWVPEHPALDGGTVPAPPGAPGAKTPPPAEVQPEFREAVVAAANELISGPGVEDRVFAWTHSDVPGPSDFASWLTQQAVLLVQRRRAAAEPAP